jgi:isopenicillin-N epimerase
MIDVDLGALGATFYTANCHKWMCAPKGAAFLWVADEFRDTIGAVAVSHGYNDGWPSSASRFHAQFDWTGTDDPTARLSVPTALAVLGTHLPGGWPAIRASNHALVHQGRELLTAALDTDTPTPAEMIGSIASLPIPLDRYPGHNALDVVESLHDNWSIEVPVSPWPAPEDRLLRISAQQYNTLNDYELLARALIS